MNSKPKSPRRFPRIPTAIDAGKTTGLIWRSTDFSVREVDNSTEFIHRLPFLIPDKIRSKQIGTFTMLFRSQSINVGEELEKAYPKTTYKGILVSQLIDRALRSVLNKTMAEIFMKAKESNDPHAKYLRGDRKAFAKAGKLKRPAQTKRIEKRAIRLASRYETILPTVVNIRGSIQEFNIEPKNVGDEAKLIRVLQKKFRKPWVAVLVSGLPLKNLPEIPGYGKSADTLNGLDWTNRQLTIGIVKCIEDKRGEQPSLSANTIMEDYLPLGRRLLKKRRSVELL